ncbi:tail fiber domain-containing protein [Citrobacter amalonaticus]|uniref:tail fiber domain-containing protein n=2 Tax=Citrobacter amalonaticus TaxID=35703 RepID=UPI0012D370C7
MRWVENYVSGGGGTGPTMNGVQNFGVGLPTLWISRAFIPAWSVVADGQILNRSDWPELWVHAQMHTPIDDADWLADPTKRCNYSNGDGATTFRVPDMNGVQDGSIWGLYGRGDAGGRYVVGSVLENGSPDIVGVIGQIGSVPNLNYPLPIVTTQGAFRQPSGRGNPRSIGTATSAQQATTLGAETVEFKASYSNAAYGRASEVRPNSFVGVWIIRASGGFTAANTLWSVINEDTEAPGTGVVARGGDVRSSYKIAGVEVARGSLYTTHSTFSSGFRNVSAVIEAWSTDASASWSFNHAGYITANIPGGNFNLQADPGVTGGMFANGDRFVGLGLRDQNTANADAVGKTWMMALNGVSGLQFIARNRAQSNVGQLVINMPYSNGTLALQGTSGLAYKHDVTDADLTEAVNRIDALRMVNFVYNDDEQERLRFGIIAEEAEKVAPQYIKHNSEEIADIMDDDGNKIGAETRDRPSVDNNPIVMDLLGYVKHLKAEIEMLKTALKGQ